MKKKNKDITKRDAANANGLKLIEKLCPAITYGPKFIERFTSTKDGKAYRLVKQVKFVRGLAVSVTRIGEAKNMGPAFNAR